MKMTQGSWTGVSQQSSSGGWTKEASNTKDEHLKINKFIN